MNMKKLIISLALISSAQMMPEWREHHGFLGGVLNTAEAVVEAPAVVVDDVVDGPYYRPYGYYDDGYYGPYYGDGYGYNRRYGRSYRRDDSRSSSTTSKSSSPTTRTARSSNGRRG